MHIVISSQGPEFESQIDPRFGRCQYFVFVNLDDMTLEAVPNPNLNQSSGVGIRSAQFVCDKGVKAVLTGNVGPKAQQVLSTAGVVVITGVSGTVRQAAEDYQANRLETGSADAGSPADVQSWQNTAVTGGGRGMGMKSGRGMGKCRAGRSGYGTAGTAGGPRDETISGLRTEADGLRQQLQRLEQRIKELEKG